MAKTAKATPSTKVFGGNAVTAGNYFISRAIVTVETLKIAGQADTEYDCLQVVLKRDNNGTPDAVECEATLSLNGCWRPRRGADDKRYQARGSFFTTLLAACQGKSFDQTRDHINATMSNRRISVNYDEYPSQHGGYGHVPIVEFLN